MKITSLSKPLIVTIFTLALLSYGFIVVNAAYPLTQWEPGETLDPTCAPGDANCSVANAWQMNLVDGYIYNDTDQVAIGTDFPIADLDIRGNMRQFSVLPSGGLQLLRGGDTSEAGAGEGFIAMVIDALTPTAMGRINLDLNADEPFAELIASNFATGTETYLQLDAADGSVQMGATGGNMKLNITDATGESYFAIGVNNANTAGEYGGSLSLEPLNAVQPAMVYEMRKNQQYALGYAAIDEGVRKYSNIYYGTLDVNNNITDVARSEASNLGVTSTFYHDSFYVNEIDINTLGIDMSTGDVGGNNEFRMPNSDEFTMSRTVDGVVLSLSDDDNNCTIDPDSGVLCSSDRTLKTDIHDFTDGLDMIMQLNPVTYHWIANPNDPQNYGFIAQEVREVVPEFVAEGANGKLLLNQGAMISPIVSAIQSLQNQITNRAAIFIDNVKEIFVKKVTTEELCIGEICFDEQEAETLKQLINTGVITENVQEEIIEEEVIVPEVVEQDEVTQEPEIVEQMQEEELEPENQEEIIVPSEPEEEIISEPEILPEPTI